MRNAGLGSAAAAGALARSGRRAIAPVPCDTGLAFVDTASGRVSLTLHRAFADAETLWKEFQTSAPVTHAQSYDCARLWHETVSAPEGAKAAIVAGRGEDGSPLFLWPLEVVTRHGLKALQWIGQEHANYNMGLFDRQFARSVSPDDIKALLAAAAAMAGGVSLAHLRNQPFEWEGMRNPFAELPHQLAADRGYAVLLDPDFETLYRNRFGGRSRNSLRRKERKLNELGPVKAGWAASKSERRAALRAFFEQKAQWFAMNGIADPFADARHSAFYEKLSELPEGTTGRLELGYLKAGDTIAATFHGARVGSRFHILLSSIINDEAGRWSPGVLLMREQIRDVCKRGLLRYDLGCGQGQHKKEWYDEEIVLFDSFIALDRAGYALSMPLALLARTKRRIKNTSALWATAQFLRRRFPRFATGR